MTGDEPTPGVATDEADGGRVKSHQLRRQAAQLYGLIICGAVLATASEDYRLVRVAGILLVTLTIYWAAETYVHWIAVRTHVQRNLSRGERRSIIADGWPLVSVCAVPLLFLAAQALLGVETSRALDLTLVVIAAMLVVEGWRMGLAGGLRGARLGIAAGATGFLGLAMIALKSLMH